eukprot:gi/632963243/ref/XP_007897771.1/ PREDICTED: complement decay-accelerating factor-like isoform X3 [Callorhinchus milii]
MHFLESEKQGFPETQLGERGKKNTPLEMWEKIIIVATVIISPCTGQHSASCAHAPSLPFAEPLEHYLLLQNFFVGTNVTYRCLPGYELNSTEPTHITCQANFNWSKPLFTCIPKDCGFPEDIPNGTYVASSHSFGSIVTYTCDVGFVSFGRAVRRCTLQGWTGNLPICQRVRCPAPDQVQNGKIKTGFRPLYMYQDSIRYECDAGYQLFGSSVITCTSNSTWDHQPPTCQRISNASHLNESLVSTFATTAINRIIDQTTAQFQQSRATSTVSVNSTPDNFSNISHLNESLVSTFATTAINRIIEQTTAQFQQSRAKSTVSVNSTPDNYPVSSSDNQMYKYYLGGGGGFIALIAAGSFVIFLGKNHFRKHGSYNAMSKFAKVPQDVEQSELMVTSIRD